MKNKEFNKDSEIKFDIFIKIWTKQTGSNNIFGNDGFTFQEKEELLKKLKESGIKKTLIKVKRHSNYN